MHENNLREWQSDALKAWRASGHRGIIEAVTGTGKTKVGLEAAFEAITDGLRVVITVPTLELADQWVEQVEQLPLVKVGRWGGASRASLEQHHVIVSTIHSAARRASSGQLTQQLGNREALLIADECHRDAAKSFSRSLHDVFIRRLGLTATLARPDGMHEERLLPYFGSVIYTIDHAQASAQGIVAEHTLMWVGFELSPRERHEYEDLGLRRAKIQRSLSAAFHDLLSFEELMRRIQFLAEDDNHPQSRLARQWRMLTLQRQRLLDNSPARVETALKLDLALSMFQPALVFTQSKAVARSLKDGYDKSTHGIHSYVIDSDESATDRRITMQMFRTGNYNTLIAPRVLDEGIDVPEAALALVVSSTRSARQMTQRLGRVLRSKAGGRPAMLIVLFAHGTNEDPGVREQLHVADIAAAAKTTIMVAAAEDLLEALHQILSQNESESDADHEPT